MITDSDAKGFFIGVMVIAAIMGWAVVELLIWLFSHISITWQ